MLRFLNHSDGKKSYSVISSYFKFKDRKRTARKGLKAIIHHLGLKQQK